MIVIVAKVIDGLCQIRPRPVTLERGVLVRSHWRGELRLTLPVLPGGVGRDHAEAQVQRDGRHILQLILLLLIRTRCLRGQQRLE